jgi:alpha-beta hydrolase superfamily lysophospholipase
MSYKRFENYFSGFNGCRIHYQRWEAEKPRGHIIITHGQGEHSESYHRVVRALEPLQLNIWAWDWRGHGRSEGTRGYAENFTDYCHDFELLLKFLFNEKIKPDDSVVLLSHSMGGLIQLKSLLDNPSWPVRAQVLSAPLLEVAVPVPQYKEIAAQLFTNFLPKVTLGNEITNEMLSRDKAIWEEFNKDPLRHHRISSGVYLGAKEMMKQILPNGSRIKIPTLLQIADHDPVVSTPKALEFMDHVSDDLKTVKVYPGRKHEIYNDLDRDEVFADLRQFISQFI